MISINQWFTKNTKIPIIAASALLAIIWILASIGMFEVNSRHRSKVVDNLTNTLSLALSQNNRILIESLLDTTMVQLGATDVLICRQGKVVVGVNSSYRDCSKSFSENKIIPGFADHFLLITYPPIWRSLNLWMVMILGFLFVMFTVFISRRMQARFSNEILAPFSFGLIESGPMKIKEFDVIRLQLKEAQEAKTQKEIAVAMNTLASQVAHDILSPLSALNMMMGQLDKVPEQQRVLMRSSIQRINDIANELLQKGKQINEREKNSHPNPNSNPNLNPGAVDSLRATKEGKSGEAPALPLKIELLAPIIDSLVSEKRSQFREKQGVQIEADVNLGYGLFANINSTELKRTISNLLNNAIEAFPEAKGRVVVALRNYSKKACLIVQDNGKGIPEHILAKLGEMGLSHGKEGSQSGSGLGVYHAKKTVENFGGNFDVVSKVGHGTTITMSFPKAAAPSWFVETLVFKHNSKVISLDDDISIHQVWKGRFESKNFSSVDIEHLTFTSGNEFKEWLKNKTSASIKNPFEECLFLMDYELLNQKATGLDLIEELGIGKQSFLVSSRYEEDSIRSRCANLGVKLIPKAMAGFVPIEIEKPKELYHAVLIDDEIIPHMMWGMMAEEKNKKFIGSTSPKIFSIKLMK